MSNRNSKTNSASSPATTTSPSSSLSSTGRQQQQHEPSFEARQRQQILKRSLADSHATQTTANETASTLARQGEQISRISSKLDGVESDLKTADHHTKSIGSWFGMVWNMMKGAPKDSAAKPGEAAAAAAAAGTLNNHNTNRTSGGATTGSSNVSANKNQQNTKTSQKKDDDAVVVESEEEDPDEALENALLDQLQASVHGVMQSAKSQGQVIRSQNAALDETSDKMDKVGAHMQRTNKKINRLL